MAESIDEQMEIQIKETEKAMKKNSEQDNSISEMQEELKNLRNISNMLPTISKKGENITINNTAKNVQFRKFEISGNAKQDREASLENQIEIKAVGSNVNIFDITKYNYRNFNEASVEIADSTNFRIIATTSKNTNNAVGFKIMDLTEYARKNTNYKSKSKI